MRISLIQSLVFFSLNPVVQKPRGVRLYLCLFWWIEHFLSLFDIFQISGDCFPPLDVIWALANRNTHCACA